jgi:hypothetical protein
VDREVLAARMMRSALAGREFAGTLVCQMLPGTSMVASIGQGRSNRQIAARLVASQRTVESHVDNVLRKLGFASRVQVAAWITTQHRDGSPDRPGGSTAGRDAPTSGASGGASEPCIHRQKETCVPGPAGLGAGRRV